jgi:hypothetical protein
MQTGPVRQREEIVKKYAYLDVAEDEIVWAEDLDVSAFKIPPMRRPELRKALLALPPGSNIMFYRLDRFVRRVFPDWSDTVAFAAQGKHRLVSATEPIDLSDIMGQMAATLFAFVGEMESRHRELSEAETTEPDAAILRPTGQSFRERWEGTDALDRRVWMLETGVRVIARRKRWPKLDLPGGPLGPETMGEEVPRSILGEDGDTYAAILLGDMADLLRRVSEG